MAQRRTLTQQDGATTSSAPTPPATGAAFFARFAKGSGQAPQYGTLAPPGVRPATAKFVQAFDPRAIMQEQPSPIDAGPKGAPARDARQTVLGRPPRMISYDDAANMRADNQVLVRDVPTSDKSDRMASEPNRLRMYRDASGENLR